MRAFVTGGTGLLGANVVRALLERGDDVVCLARRGSPAENLEGLPVAIVEGDIRQEAEELAPLMAGCEEVYHVAAAYTLWSADPGTIYASNVAGTRNVLAAAVRAGAKRIVHTSSVAAVGRAGGRVPADERRFPDPAKVPGHYERSKYFGEQVALGMAQAGAPIVIVNPTAPIGPFDVRPTPTGKVLLDAATGRLPAVVRTGLNFVDVRDCARGHLLAAERGRPGQRYILGGENLELEEVAVMAMEAAGRRRPLPVIPWSASLVAALLDEGVRSRLTGLPPAVPLAGVRLAREYMWFSSDKARAELGYDARPAREAVEAAVDWWRGHGYLSR